MVENKDRRKEKREKSLRIKNIIIFIEILILTILVIIIAIGLNYDAFNIHSIIFENDGYTSKEEVIEILGKNNINTNIFLFDTDKAEEKLIKNIDNLTHLSIYKTFPNILNIRMKEAYAIGYIEDETGITFIDQDGNLKYGDSFEKNDDLFELNFNKSIVLTDDILQFIKELSKRNFASSISKINFEKNDTIDIMYKDITIYFESLEDSTKKLDELEKVLLSLESEDFKVKSIYMDKNDRPVIVKEKSMD